MVNEPSEAIELIGVVQPPGAGGARDGKQELWSLVFSVHPWRSAGGPLDSRKLRLRQSGFTHDQLRCGMDSIKPYTILRARVKFLEPRPNMLFSAEVLEILSGDDPDAELSACAAEQQKPIVIPHPLFGPLTLDRGLVSFQATVSLAGQPIELSIDAIDDLPDPTVLAIAERFWKDQANWDHRLREFAVAQLIELKNDAWLQADEEALTEGQFIRKMTPNSMGFDPPEGFTIYYNDGDIFWGHAIEIRGTLSKGPESADIAG
jgi:hypothetical protein